MYWESHVKLLDAAKYRTKRPGNRCNKMYRCNLKTLSARLIKEQHEATSAVQTCANRCKPVNSSLMIHIELLLFTNKQTRTIKYTCDTGYMYMDLSFLVYFPLSNLKLYLILVFVMFFLL